MQRLLFAIALLICSTAAQAGAAAARAQNETDPPCVATADNDCDAAGTTTAGTRPTGQVTTEGIRRGPRRGPRGEAVRAGASRFQSFLPGMIR